MKSAACSSEFSLDGNSDKLPDKVALWRHANFHQIACPIGHYPRCPNENKVNGIFIFQGIHINPTDFPWYSETSNPIAFPA
jgi:hypothetical protein